MVQYLIEGRHTLTPQDLTVWGLGHAFDGSPSRRATANGPNGQGGVVIGVGESIGYFPETQTWTQLPAIDGAPTRWLGLPKPPPKLAPESLRRATQLPGHLVTLADGQQWLVPAAKRFDVNSQRYDRAVGSRLRLNSAGEWMVEDVLPQYAELWAAATRWFDYRDDGSLMVAEAADMCVVALTTNYRVSRAEVGALGLLDDKTTIAEVLNAVIDQPTFVEWCQKKSREESLAAGG